MARSRVDQRDHAGDLVAQKQPQVERDLIVARAPGMQLAPGLADHRDQPALDREMDVFIGNVEFEHAPLDLVFDAARVRRRSHAFRRA